MNEAYPLDAPGIPRDLQGPVFNEPWEAKAFAMALELHQRGAFTWAEWCTEVSREIGAVRSRGDADLGDTYYQHWLRALESMVVRRGAGTMAELERCQHAWAHAAKRTPHGSPIELCAKDFNALAPP